jgi:adenylate kinase
VRIVLMGPPGAGKGTQAAMLSADLRAIHVSTGDILREAVKDGTELGGTARSFMEAGKLVPDSLMGDLIRERIARSDVEAGFILDGFPRTAEQVHILNGVLEELGVGLDGVVILTVPEREIIRRLSSRRVCPGCNAVFHLDSRPSEAPGVCDKCGSALVQRADDKEEVIRDRIAVYEEQTRPVAEAYRSLGILMEIDGLGEPAEVAGRIEKKMKELIGA